MLNCSVASICSLASQITVDEVIRDKRVNGGVIDADSPLNEEEVQRVLGWMKVANTVCTDFDLTAAQDRVDQIRKKVSKGMSQGELAYEYRVLRETLDKGLRGHFLYRYPAAKVTVLQDWTTDWKPTLNAFPSTRNDVVAAVDLWALGHDTASVFHSMRVVEHGLRALAFDLEVTFTVEVWQTVLESIEARIRALGPSLPRGSAKSERLRFLAQAAKEFFYFKDGWRNHVAHNKLAYDEKQSKMVMDHVRSFMNLLSSQLREAA